MTIRFLILMLGFYSTPAYAYIGPGASLGMFTIALTLITGIIFLILALIWFPLKRKFKSNKEKSILTKKNDTD